MYSEQMKKFPDESVERIIEEAFKLYPQEIDISDGELRSQNGFYSEGLAYSFHNAGECNMPYSEELDYMIWAVYGELHKKSIDNFNKGIMTVSLSELSHYEICREYFKSSLKDKLNLV